jgi:choline dehydrogenase-like flavoprotein
LEIVRKTPVWDAIVVGSGANGGVAARQLTAAGLRVLVLEAGPPVNEREDYGNPITNVSREVWRHLVTRRQQVQERHATYWNSNPDFFVDDVDNPYTTPPDKPFRWIRGRVLGGRTLTWDGVTPRMSDFEFKAASRDGIGTDWPFGHADLHPYYSDLCRFFRVHGSKESLPQLPDGDFQAPGTLTPAERVLKERVEGRFKDRKVIISRGMGAGRSPGSVEPHSRLSSVGTSLQAAAATGLLTIRTDAVVSRILVSPDGTRATSVEFINSDTHRTEEVRGRLIFLCASTIESVRILMNSRSRAHPGGIGASSGVLGHYLMDHIAGNVYFHMPEIPDDGQNYDLLGSESIMIPRFQNLEKDSTEDYPRGFGLWGCVQRLPIYRPLWKHREAFGFLCARGEVLPNFDNRVELDPVVRDAWGIPAVHISFEFKDEDVKTLKAGKQAAEEMIETAGGKITQFTDLVWTPIIDPFVHVLQKDWARAPPGLFVHEVGGARMGVSPKTSVLDPFCSAWDVPNVFVTDGACWPSSGWQNPTLTEMAVTARACDHAVASLRREP